MRIRNNDVRVYSIGGKVNLVPGVNQVDDKLWEKAAGKTPTKAVKALFDDKTLEVLGGSDSGGPQALGPIDGNNDSTPTGYRTGDITDPEGSEDSEGSTDSGDNKAGDQDLSDMKADEAINLVGDTLDRDTLEAWKRSEKRKTVLEAIDTQLELTKA